jgi:hypothetical protein
LHWGDSIRAERIGHVRAQSKPATSRDNLSGRCGDRCRRARRRCSLCSHKLAVVGRTSGAALTVRRFLVPWAAEITQSSCIEWGAGRRTLGYIRARERTPAVRPNFVLLASLGFIAASIQTACVHSQAPPVWGYYDRCAAENPSFLAMAECGRQKRLAECVPSNTCSPEGTVFMEYVDSLALSVKNKKMTEAEAMRRYAEYKSGGTSTCAQVGGAVKC